MIRVGPAGWSYADWEGRVYPKRKPPGFHPLRHLSRFVDCVELNASFYSLVDARNAARWVEIVAPRPAFRFTAKLHQEFTHGPRGGADAGDAGERWRGLRDAFLEGLRPLIEADRLGALLVQFPWSFRRSAAAEERLHILRDLFGELPLVLEVRHRSWFEDEVLRWLADQRYSLARIDLPEARDHPPPNAPTVGDIGYLRLHGRNARAWFDPRAGRDQRYDYLYGPDEITQLVRVARTLASGRDETYVVTNNHFSGQAVANALEILAALRDQPPLAPVELVGAFPRLSGHVRAEGQGELY